MKLTFLRYFLFTALAAVYFSACVVTKPYERPEMKTDSLFRNAEATDTNTIARVKWKDLFQDEHLHNLIETGLVNNLDLKIALERVQQAEAYFSQSRAAFLPSLDASAGVNVSRFSEVQNPLKKSAVQYQLGLSSAWEADIWGKLKSTRRASLASLLQTEAAGRALQTSIVSGVANYYYLLLALDRQLAITEQTVGNWDITVQTMRNLKESGRVTEAAVVQSLAQRYAAEVTIPDLKQRIQETENALNILIGHPPAAVVRGSIDHQQLNQSFETGVPAQLLAFRPDVQQAEYNFRYQFEMTNVARTYFYPSLNITGSAGLSALSIGDLFSGNAFAASIGGGLLQPILNKKANKTRLAVALSEQRAAYFDFQYTLLNAGREVSDAISNMKAAEEKINIRVNQLSALEKSVEYSQELLQNGFGNTNYTEIITARQSLLQAELNKVNDRLQLLQSQINLYRALGGGWE